MFSTKPLDLPLGEGLGQWEEQSFDGIMYLQSGVYYVKHDGEWALKTRGFSPRGHSPDLWLSHLSNLPGGVDIGLSVRHHRFGTVPSHETFARWYSTDHTLRLDAGESKRMHDPSRCESCASGLSYGESIHPLHVPRLLHGKSTSYPFPWTNPQLLTELEQVYGTQDPIDYAEVIEA